MPGVWATFTSSCHFGSRVRLWHLVRRMALRYRSCLVGIWLAFVPLVRGLPTCLVLQNKLSRFIKTKRIQQLSHIISKWSTSRIKNPKRVRNQWTSGVFFLLDCGDLCYLHYRYLGNACTIVGRCLLIWLGWTLFFESYQGRTRSLHTGFLSTPPCQLIQARPGH